MYGVEWWTVCAFTRVTLMFESWVGKQRWDSTRDWYLSESIESSSRTFRRSLDSYRTKSANKWRLEDDLHTSTTCFCWWSHSRLYNALSDWTLACFHCLSSHKQPDMASLVNVIWLCRKPSQNVGGSLIGWKAYSINQKEQQDDKTYKITIE